ncbi:MarR family transcriptional regulator [Paenibacillus sp. ClWae2A]|uniref:MarR family winged helix-turn-helix transcriptional regulator n=1 Tax=Paenibacillus sp. ClWae2A TaxID=3057177 RepID=UPI0028F4D43D|nr:MarR family transcriptional regulator [Paenibacillus sp. ClWae2A]MDT9717537.1 MarR family transcriptional regulator [Paenibacillus sp. ClWae2A]
MQQKSERLNVWLSLSNIHTHLNEKLEQALLQEYGLSLKEFYVLNFIFNAEDKKLRLLQLQELVGLSQSATSRLVVRMEARDCGALERHTCEDDRRGIYTRITELGENKYKRALETFNQVLQTELEKDGFETQLENLTRKLFQSLK